MQSWMVRRLALGSIAGLGVAAEPVAEARRSKSRVFTRGEALIVHVYAVVERAGVAHNLSRPRLRSGIVARGRLAESVRDRPDRTCRSTAQRGRHRPPRPAR